MTDPGAVRPKRSVFALVRQLVSGAVALEKLAPDTLDVVPLVPGP